MLPYGITKLEQIPSKVSHDFPYEISFDLLGELDGNSERDNSIIELIADRMPGGLHLENIRRTYENRFAELDSFIASYISDKFPSDVTVRVHDVATSNAISALSLFDTLCRRHNIQLIASDLHTEIVVVEVGGGWRVIFDSCGRPIQYVGPQTVIRKPLPAFWRHPLQWIQSTYVVAKKLRAAETIRSSSDIARTKIRTISLFHPKAIERAKSNPRFRLDQVDITSLPPRAYEVVRAMSVLFTWKPELLHTVLHSLANSVVDGGLLVIGRNRGHVPGTERWSAFVRSGRKMKLVFERDGGTPERDAVLALSLAKFGDNTGANASDLGPGMRR